MEFIKQFGTVAAIFLAFDIAWISLVASKFYKKTLGGQLAENPNMFAGGIFYLIAVIAMIFLVLMPALQAGSGTQALLKGVLLGVFGFATYNFTNAAILKSWPWSVVVVDTLWGGFVFGAVCYLSFLILS